MESTEWILTLIITPRVFYFYFTQLHTFQNLVSHVVFGSQSRIETVNEYW